MAAYYNEVIGEIQQRPVSCFSKSPCVIPMWAHYAHNHSGIVLEIDEDIVLQHFPDMAFGDVDYLDETSEDLEILLERAYSIGKPRYHYMLQKGVYSTAYYTKQKCWEYEQESRLVTKESDIERNNNMMLLRLPIECVTSIIVGQKTNEDIANNVSEFADEIGAEFYRLKIGKTITTPYFVDGSGCSYQFDGKNISVAENSCESCGEPISASKNNCSWCAIEKHHEMYAAQNNPFRMLHRHGLLEGYYRTMNEIDEKK